MRDRYLIVTAGGSGTRMGAALPKQFLELSGVPILHRTIARFQEACPGIHILTVLPADHLQAWRRYCQLYGADERALARLALSARQAAAKLVSSMPQFVSIYRV